MRADVGRWLQRFLPPYHSRSDQREGSTQDLIVILMWKKRQYTTLNESDKLNSEMVSKVEKRGELELGWLSG